jgi:RNA polymerase sigma-70 factor (ECF subfamily)
LNVISNSQDNGNQLAPDDDRYLVSLCKKGDAGAFKALVEKYQKKMLNTAYRMTGDYQEACEVVQEAFLSAYKAIGKFRGEAMFSTWLTGITMNHSRNRVKQMKSRAYHEVSSIDDPAESGAGHVVYQVPSPEPPAMVQLEQKELQARVQEAIASLDEEYRAVLVLRDIQEFSYEEIRDILKIPEGTVKSRLFRARGAVKSYLKKVVADL